MPALPDYRQPTACRAAARGPRAPHKDTIVWLYIPHMRPYPASLSAQALGDWNSACMSQNPDIELCVTSSGTCSPRPLSWPGWRTRPWMTLLSGPTFDPSTLARGVERFLSSLPDIPASPSPIPVTAGEPTILVTSGRMCAGSPERLDHGGASSKTSKGTSPWEPPKSSETFAAWAIASRQACSRREKSAQGTSAADSSLWPTPTRSISCNHPEIELSSRGVRLRKDLSKAGSQYGIGRVAAIWTSIWILFEAAGVKPTRTAKFRYSRPLHLILRSGTRYSPGELIYNPAFSDWIMGWPVGWTDTLRPVTGWSAWLRRMRGALSRLPCCEG